MQTESTQARMARLRDEWARREMQHIGSLRLYKFNPIIRAVLTEGTKDMADLFQCYWLFDVIASVQHGMNSGLPEAVRNGTQVWHVDAKSPDDTVEVWLQPSDMLEDDAREMLGISSKAVPFYQRLERTPFPLEHTTFIVQRNEEGYYVIMLPGER